LNAGRHAPTAAILFSIVFLSAQAWLCVRPAMQTDADTAYLGFPYLPTDHYAYMMYTAQTAKAGDILVDNQFTTSPQDGRFLMIGLAAAGAIQRLVPLPDPVVWHALRLIALAIFCLVLWKICVLIFDRRWKASAAFAFVLFSGGVDWIARLVGRDWFTSTGKPWANFLDNPWNFSVFFASTNMVWAVPMTIVAAAVLFEIKAARALAATSDVGTGSVASGRKTLYIRGLSRGLVFAVLWFIHPYTAIVWGAMVVVSAVVPQKGLSVGASILTTIPAAIGPALVGAFIMWSQQDPVVAASNAQTGLWKLSYPVFLYPIVYGPWLLLPLALVGRNRPIDGTATRWLLIWLGAGLVMTINPFITGAKFQVAMAMPLALLEVAGLFALTDYLASKLAAGARTIPIVATVIAIASANSIAVVAADFVTPAARNATTTPTGHLRQLETLADLPDGGVLCDPYEGMLVPWKAGKHVFVGQWFLSTRHAEKAELVRWFFSGKGTPEQLAGFLDAANVRWVLYGPRERESGLMPTINGLTLRTGNADRQIWEWKAPGKERRM